LEEVNYKMVKFGIYEKGFAAVLRMPVSRTLLPFSRQKEVLWWPSQELWAWASAMQRCYFREKVCIQR